MYPMKRFYRELEKLLNTIRERQAISIGHVLMCCVEIHSQNISWKEGSKERKWKTSMQNTRLDEEKRQRVYMSEFERDGAVSNYMEKLVHKTRPWAENIFKEERLWESE